MRKSRVIQKSLVQKSLVQKSLVQKLLAIGGALLALAAFASTADARMMGGMSMPSSMSRGDAHTPMTSSLGSSHGFSPDGRTFSADGLGTRIKGSNWKKPIDSDQGGADDPLPKPPKTQTSSNGNGSGGYYGGWNPGHHHYGYYGPYNPNPNGGNSGPPLACRGRPGGC